jgi:low temperature requirement protein LtrA
MVLVSGLVSQAWSWILWVAACVPILTTTFLHRERGFHMSPSHFVERHGLVILIALGESVVAIGTGAADRPVTLSLLGAVVLGLALAAALWWAYFDGDDVRAEHAMMHADPIARARLGVYAYYHAHLLLIAGIVIAAAGIQPALADPAAPTESTTGWLLSSGVALYLIGGAVFRLLLHTGSPTPRLVAAAVVLTLAPLGVVDSHAQLTAIILVLLGLLVVERREAATAPALASHE